MNDSYNKDEDDSFSTFYHKIFQIERKVERPAQ